MNRPARWATGATWMLVTSAWLITCHAENWPNWRGPRQNSTSKETGLPLFWREDSGIAWKCPLPGSGDSTPAIWGDAVFITTQNGSTLELLRINKADGHIVWTRKVADAPEEPPRKSKGRGQQKFHRLQNMASPSPVTDGEVVVVHFGNGVLAAYDFDGHRLWRRNLQQDYGPYTIWWGHANSPVLFDDLVISVCMQDSLADMQETPAESYLVAHDKQTGREKWKTPRNTGAQAEQCDAYTTPVLEEIDGRTDLVVMGGNQLDAYDPQTGRQRWYMPRLVGGRTITGPTASGELLFATVGMRGALLALRGGGAGERSRREALWKHDAGTPDSCCPVAWGELLFVITDQGIAKCFDAHRGHQHWKRRLGGNDYKASPLAVDDRIYCLSRDGLCVVLSASSRFNQLARNQLDDEFLASPAVSDGHLFLRGQHKLYCIGRR